MMLLSRMTLLVTVPMLLVSLAAFADEPKAAAAVSKSGAESAKIIYQEDLLYGRIHGAGLLADVVLSGFAMRDPLRTRQCREVPHRHVSDFSHRPIGWRAHGLVGSDAGRWSVPTNWRLGKGKQRLPRGHQRGREL